jgi:hypothetical protein
MRLKRITLCGRIRTFPGKPDSENVTSTCSIVKGKYQARNKKQKNAIFQKEKSPDSSLILQ